jgi:hypothetical protein
VTDAVGTGLLSGARACAITGRYDHLRSTGVRGTAGGVRRRRDPRAAWQPGLTFGCASGDRIRVDEDGSFEVQRRSGNLCLRIYPAGVPTDSDVEPLTAAFAQLDGIVEMPANRRFIVITVPVTAGFPTVQAAVSAWTDAHSCNWDYGNVYDEHDQPLNWWIDN